MTDSPSSLPESLAAVERLFRADDAECLAGLLPAAALDTVELSQAEARAIRWIAEIRRGRRPASGAAEILANFGLSSREGVALMCLAEALLRIPDARTADLLIGDKLGTRKQADDDASGDDMLFGDGFADGQPWTVDLMGWMLAMTGRVVDMGDMSGLSPSSLMGRLVATLGKPVIREALRAAIGWMAGQFVMGESIGAALERSLPAAEGGTRFSFDMLGEGARTKEDAENYFNAYSKAIDAVGKHHVERKLFRPNGISVKLSALHPRYEWAQRERVSGELVPRLASLCEQAAGFGIPLTIDAEESERLYLALDVFENLLRTADLNEWDGLGFAVQAYEKRAPAVIDWFAALAAQCRRRLTIRLVKGAYWDGEIKRAQEKGWSDFPVYTRKPATDVSYLACARRMLDLRDRIQPVFGTHNALTAARVLEMARDPSLVEFQHLHGMGEELYKILQNEGVACCVYAPVGNHEVLLGYLVRRLLENGANSSFVNRLYDQSVPIERLTADPVEEVRGYPDKRHKAIRRPAEIFAPERRNSRGLDMADPFVADPFLEKLARLAKIPLRAAPLVNGKEASGDGKKPRQVCNPANLSEIVGLAQEAEAGDVDAAMRSASDFFARGVMPSVHERALCLTRLADLIEEGRDGFISVLIREAGKTLPDAISEVREAVDFCRYYAARAQADFAPLALPGPVGEENVLSMRGRGVFVCISPWNFPLAIFIGQIAAALAAGNCVVAKPAPQTPLTAARAADLIIEAGFPPESFHLLTGSAAVGAMLTRHRAVSGVAFTGSVAAARAINRTLAASDGPIVPLIAETGGMNAMIADSSALPEQLVDDVVTGAFRSAGQRCSALRLLFLPEATANKTIAMLRGAMRELRVGDPALPSTDVGPVIDLAARQRLFEHVKRLKVEARELATAELGGDCANGTFIAPQAWEIPAADWLKDEVFGPILHVARYDPSDLDAILSAINAAGFGLTAGAHSRVASTVRRIEKGLRAGNLYVNRSMIGAVVGSQPFGGEGLSGTGPKAGGPNYLKRFALERVTSTNTAAAGGNASLLAEAGESDS